MAGGVQGWVTEDPDADWPEVARHVAYQLDSYRRHIVQGTDAPVPRPVDPEKLRTREPRTRWITSSTARPRRSRAGCGDKVGDAPVDTVYFWASIGGMPEKAVARHIQTVCTKLAPLLK